MSDLINIKDERFWEILFDEACVEGKQAERIEKELERITVEPVRGEWEYQWFDSVCSNCGYINKADSVTRIRDDHNFCPNCGADMRGEKND